MIASSNSLTLSHTGSGCVDHPYCWVPLVLLISFLIEPVQKCLLIIKQVWYSISSHSKSLLNICLYLSNISPPCLLALYTLSRIVTFEPPQMLTLCFKPQRHLFQCISTPLWNLLNWLKCQSIAFERNWSKLPIFFSRFLTLSKANTFPFSPWQPKP